VNEFFSMYSILPASPGPGVYSKRNKYQKEKTNVSGERMTMLLLSVSGLSLASHDLIGPHGLLRGLLYFDFTQPCRI
jgi:hypothetical protein